MDPGQLTAFTALVVAVLTGLGWLGRRAWRAMRRIMHFLDDYQGQPERDGRPAVHGFMARLTDVESSLRLVLSEVQANHGKSLRDVVMRTAADVADIKDEQVRVRGDLAKLRGSDAKDA